MGLRNRWEKIRMYVKAEIPRRVEELNTERSSFCGDCR